MRLVMLHSSVATLADFCCTVNGHNPRPGGKQLMRTSLTSSLAVVIAATIGVLLPAAPAIAQQFVDGLAQPVFNVTGANLITHNVWVEIPNLDTDRDGINDRIRVQIRRPA